MYVCHFPTCPFYSATSNESYLQGGMNDEQWHTDSPRSNSSPPYQQQPLSPPDSPQARQYAALAPEQPLGYRLSDKQRPLSPELISPGLESVWADEGNKEVFYPNPEPQAYEPPQLYVLSRKRRICGMLEMRFFVLIVVSLALAVALGVGLGVGLGTKNPTRSQVKHFFGLTIRLQPPGHQICPLRQITMIT